MNVLMLCNNYSLELGHSWLSDSMAAQLAVEHTVTVIFLDWSGKYKEDFTVIRDGVEVHVCSTALPIFSGRFGKILKWLLAAKVHSRSARSKFFGRKFDVLINFSPTIVMHPFFSELKKQVEKSYLILWDFFPIYHAQLKLLPKFLIGGLRFLENRAINQYDTVGLMSPENVKFMRKNYKIRHDTRTEILLLWGPNDIFKFDPGSYKAARKEMGVDDQLVCVFGGQLIRGRGVDKLIELAVYAKKENINAKFYIFGDGPERDAILGLIKEFSLTDLVVYKGFRPRSEYLEFLKGADLGLVFNSGDVLVPTFPSKVIDYLRVSMPVLAYVEDATDFGHFVEQKMRAGWSASPSRHQALFDGFCAAAKLPKNELRDMGKLGQKWYLEHMTVEIVSEQIIAVGQNQTPIPDKI